MSYTFGVVCQPIVYSMAVNHTPNGINLENAKMTYKTVVGSSYKNRVGSSYKNFDYT